MGGGGFCDTALELCVSTLTVGLMADTEIKRTLAHLEDVVSWFDVSDVDPLAVDVVTVQIPAAHSDALIAKVGTFVAFRNTCVAQTIGDFQIMDH